MSHTNFEQFYLLPDKRREMKTIFIVGASRSGTTMLNRILGNHREILAMNELHYFGELWLPDLAHTPLPHEKLVDLASMLIARINNSIWGENPSTEEIRTAGDIVSTLDKSKQNGAELFVTVLMRYAADHAKSIVSEQTPRNIFYARRLLELYPDSYVIQLIRDPRAVLASQKGRWRRKWLGGGNVPWSETIRVWVNYHPITMSKMWVKTVIAGSRVSDHPRFMSVQFENIVAAPKDTLKNICTFIGIEYQTGMEDVPQVGSSNANNKDNCRGMSKDVLHAWENRLNAGEIAICERLTRPFSNRLGYIPVTDRFPVIPVMILILIYPFHVIGVLLANPKRALIQLRAYMGK